MSKKINSEGPKKLIIKIGGMSCAKCAERISKAIKKIPEVREVVVNLVAETAAIEYEGDAISNNSLKKVIEDAGYIYLGQVDQLMSKQDQRWEKEEQAKKLSRVIVGFIGGFILMIIMYIPYDFGIDKSFLMFIISIPFFIYISYPIYLAGVRDLSTLNLTMDVMYAMGITISYLSSILGTFEYILSKEFMFYETAIFLATFLSLGRYLEHKAKRKTANAIEELIKLKPQKAFRIKISEDKLNEIDKNINDEEGLISKLEIEEIFAEDIRVNDLLFVKPGQKVPTDGVVITGSSYVDESIFTGESVPNLKKEGMQVIGGTINKNSVLVIQANRVGSDTFLSQVIKLVQEAQSSKLPIQRIADKVVSYFIPVILVIAILVFVLWYYIIGYSLLYGLTVMISVLVIACPCALGLATPIAVSEGLRIGAEKGILIKDSEVFERAKKITTIIFDKTGTLTYGKPGIISIETFSLDKNDLLRIVASVEKNSQHPLAEAIMNEAIKRKIDLIDVKDFNTYEGKGVIGKVNDKSVIIGSEVFLHSMQVKFSDDWEKLLMGLNRTNTLVFVAIDSKLEGVIEITDPIKEEARTVVKELKEAGLKAGIISGDRFEVAESVAKELGIDYVIAEVFPQDKVAEIERMKSRGEIVAYVGDGINDAPALAVADLGIALGSGTDVAIESGNIVLVKNNLSDVLSAIRLSRLTMRKIRRNIFWAFFYNILLIPVAAGILYPFFGIMLKPEYAGLAMALSSFTIVLWGTVPGEEI